MPRRPMPKPKPVPAPTDRMHALVEHYVAWMGAQNFSTDTLNSSRICIGYFLDWCKERSIEDVTEITQPVLERYQRALYYYRKKDGAPLTFRTQATRLRLLKGWFRWLARQNYLLHNPASELLLPRLENRLPKYILSAEEAEQVIAQADIATPEGMRDRAILETFYATGMRRLEIVSLKLYDIDADRGTVMIRMGKGKKDRHIPIGERALAWLDKYIREARPELLASTDDGTVFLSSRGERIDRVYLTGLVRSYIRKAKIGKKGGCHLFRHTVATLMLENGADIRVIQEMLGHAKLTTTELYTRVSINLLKQVYSAGASRSAQWAGDGARRPGRSGADGDARRGRRRERRMIETGTMTTRENVHQIVDALDEEKLEDVLDYLAELSEPDEPLSAETLAAIEEGLEDIRDGRTITLEEYRRTRGL